MKLMNDVYPGQYHPSQESRQKMIHSKQTLVSNYPHSKILHVDGSYQIVVPVPGVKRENIYIKVTGDHMIVRIFDQQRISEDTQAGKRLGVLRKCFIKLPDDADANFASVTIQNSLLNIELAKKDKITRDLPGTLIPY
jgi:HSP20 family molecular chaperone IbpA